MTQLSPIEGIYTAIVTPFDENFEIDYEAFKALLEKQAAAKVNGVVVFGTTGESPTLEEDEKIELIKVARSVLPNSIKVMAGTGSNNTKKTISLSKKALEAGADSLLIVTPPYNKPNDEGMFNHFKSVADATKAAICLYHVPGRTGQLLNATQMAKICEINEVIAVKEASADLALFTNTVMKSDAMVLTGDDPTFVASLASGGKGVVSVITNVFPEVFVKIQEYINTAQLPKAQMLFETVFPLTEAMFWDSNPSPVKRALSEFGLIKNVLRAPMSPMSEDHEAEFISLLKKTEKNLKELVL